MGLSPQRLASGSEAPAMRWLHGAALLTIQETAFRLPLIAAINELSLVD